MAQPDATRVGPEFPATTHSMTADGMVRPLRLPERVPGEAAIGPAPGLLSRIGAQVQAMPRRMTEFGEGVKHGQGRWAMHAAENLLPNEQFSPYELAVVDSMAAAGTPDTPAGTVGRFGGEMAGEFTLAGDAQALQRVPGLLEEGAYGQATLEGLSAIPVAGALVGPLAAMGRLNRVGLDAMSTSRLTEAIRNAPQDRASGSQWAGMIRKTPGGVPSGEMEWTGITGLLGDNPDRVFTRDELLQIMDERGVKLKESWYGRSGASDGVDLYKERELAQIELDEARELTLEAQEEFGLESREYAEAALHEGEVRAALGVIRQKIHANQDNPRALYSNWRIERSDYNKPTRTVFGQRPPENYREVTLQLESPGQSAQAASRLEQEDFLANALRRHWDINGYPDRTEIQAHWAEGTSWDDVARSALTDPAYREEAFDALTDAELERWDELTDRSEGWIPSAQDAARGEYQSVHWPADKNVLVHMRMSDIEYTNPETGKQEKVLFLEEIQSDWHQTGRKKGYQEPRTPDPEEVQRAQQNLTDLWDDRSLVQEQIEKEVIPDLLSDAVDTATMADHSKIRRQPDGTWVVTNAGNWQMPGYVYESGSDLYRDMIENAQDLIENVDEEAASFLGDGKVRWSHSNNANTTIFETNAYGLHEDAYWRGRSPVSPGSSSQGRETHEAWTSLRNNPLIVRLHELQQEARRGQESLRRAEATVSNPELPPQGPYETTGEWTELALRRAIQEAVDGGYDRIAWAHGRQAGEAMGVRDYVDQLQYDTKTNRLYGTEAGEALGLRVDEFEIDGIEVSPEDLPSIVGQGPAERLLDADQTGGVKWHIEDYGHTIDGEPHIVVTGQRPGQAATRSTEDWTLMRGREYIGTKEFTSMADAEEWIEQQKGMRFLDDGGLRVGGEGMIGYYGKIVPRIAQKYGRQLDGIEIDNIDLGVVPTTKGQWYIRDTETGGDAWDQRFDTRADADIALDDHAIGRTGLGEDLSTFEKLEVANYVGDNAVYEHTPGSRTSGLMNLSFAITPEMRRRVSQGDQRLWGAGALGLLGANAAAQRQNDEQNQGNGLLTPSRR